MGENKAEANFTVTTSFWANKKWLPLIFHVKPHLTHHNRLPASRVRHMKDTFTEMEADTKSHPCRPSGLAKNKPKKINYNNDNIIRKWVDGLLKLSEPIPRFLAATKKKQQNAVNLLIVHCLMRLYELNCDQNCVGYSQTEQTAALFFFLLFFV